MKIMKSKNPAKAAVLNFLFPGLGFIYLRNYVHIALSASKVAGHLIYVFAMAIAAAACAELSIKKKMGRVNFYEI